MVKKYIYSYKVLNTTCKKKWRDSKVIRNVYDKLADERNTLKRGTISCGCCIPPKDILVELTSKREVKKDEMQRLY